MDKHLLSWDVQKDLGFYPVDETWYDKAYFEASIKNAKSPIASELNEFRTTLVNSFTTGLVLDFGVGVGQFMHWRKNCLGYDICPQAVAKLRKEGLFFDPYEEDLDERGIEGVTFFDSLESNGLQSSTFSYRSRFSRTKNMHSNQGTSNRGSISGTSPIILCVDL